MKIVRKGYIAMLLMALMVVMLAACGGNAQAEREIYETAIDDMLDAMGVPPIFSEGDGNASSSADGGEQAVADIDLGLPIVVQNTTFAHYNRHLAYMRITSDGHLQRSVGRIADDEWEIIATDVRSIELVLDGGGFHTAFFIKSDNSLWAFGSNVEGRLGDGTGLDRDEPVHILDNVAMTRPAAFGGEVYALQFDGTLWTWGAGIFEPTHLMNDVVNIIHLGNLMAFQTRIGYFYEFNSRGDALERTRRLAEPAFDMVLAGNDPVTARIIIGYVNHARVLVLGGNEIADSVERLINSNHFLKSDGSLWGLVSNTRG